MPCCLISPPMWITHNARRLTSCRACYSRKKDDSGTNSRLSRRVEAIGALTISLSLSVSFPVLCARTNAAPALPKSTVYTNPRASSDDPRIGLKPGLYDAGEAAFGMERLVSCRSRLASPPVMPLLPPRPHPNPRRLRDSRTASCSSIRLRQFRSGLQWQPSFRGEL